MEDKDKEKKENKEEVSKDEMENVTRFEKTLKANEEINEALEVLKYNEEAFIEAMTQSSKMFWGRYNALIKEGFTKQQAFELILKRGLE